MFSLDLRSVGSQGLNGQIPGGLPWPQKVLRSKLCLGAWWQRACQHPQSPESSNMAMSNCHIVSIGCWDSYYSLFFYS